MSRTLARCGSQHNREEKMKRLTIAIITIIVLAIPIAVAAQEQPNIEDLDLEYPRPKFTSMCWHMPEPYGPFVTFQVTQDIPIWLDSLSMKWSHVELHMAADNIPPGWNAICPEVSCLWSWYLQRDGREPIPGNENVIRYTWKNSIQIASHWYDYYDLDFRLYQAYVMYHSGVNAPCFEAPCVIPFDEFDNHYPITFDPDPSGRQEIGGPCPHESDMTHEIFLPTDLYQASP